MSRRIRPTSSRPATGSPASASAPAAAGARWPIALIAGAGLLTYANALGHPFVFDDALTVVDNATIRAIGSSLPGGPVQTATAGRPLVNLSLALNYAADALSPWGYHLFNLGVHIGCALLLFAGTVTAWFVAPPLAFLGTWFFVTLAPTSSFLPIATEVGAERRMYLPLIAVITLAVLAAMQALRRLETEPMRTNVARGTVAAVCVVLALLTVGRNREYATTLGLWQTVVERWPNARAFYNLGTELQAAGLQAQEVESYQRALPGSADAHYALGFELQAQGQFDEALRHYREFLRLKPEDINAPRAWHQIGRTLLAQGKRDEAIAAFRQVLARRANDPDALAGIADTLLAQDKLADAVSAYHTYLRVRPNTTDAMMNLGIALVRLDRDGEARTVFADITQLEPGNVQAHVNLAFAMANTNMLADSVREFRRAIELEKDPAARAEIEGFLAELLGNH